MVHTPVVVALPAGHTPADPSDDPALTDAMAPFDGDRVVAPYPDYTEFQIEPAKFWAVKYLRMRCGLTTPPDRLTWTEVAVLFNRYYAPEEGDAPILFDDQGRPYFESTFNPDSEWDSWQIGGRSSGHFHVRPDGADPSLLVNPVSTSQGLRCDGGRKGLLDFESMRATAALKADHDWSAFELCATEHPPALGWSSFSTLISADYHRTHAEQDYLSQPLVCALYKTDLADTMDFALDAPDADRASYIRRRRLRATTGAALLTLAGHWISEPFTGWIGSPPHIRTAALAYRVEADAYLTSLPDDTWLVMVDAHS